MKAKRLRQREFGFTNWGGKRRGAGSKPKGGKAGVSHAKRPKLAPRFPVHVTVKLTQGLPSLRTKAGLRVVRSALAEASARFEFRAVEYSVQTNHVHVIAESSDERMLTRAMRGLTVRIARALNKLWRRAGRIFADRYHARILKTPREVRNALVYVLMNARKHGVWNSRDAAEDPYSSGRWFGGWKEGRASAASNASEAPLEASFRSKARTWLLCVGWKHHGLIPRLSAPTN